MINRHIAPITIPDDEIYKYVSSNLDFSETYKEKNADLDSAVEDVEIRIKGVLQQHWYDKYVKYLIYGALVAVSIVIFTVIVKIVKCLNICERRPNRHRTEANHFEMQQLHLPEHRPSLVRVPDV